MYSVDLTNRYVETMEIDDFLDLFPQSEVLRRLGNLCVCIIIVGTGISTCFRERAQLRKWRVCGQKSD